MALTHERLLEVIVYDMGSGVFFWCASGQVAGNTDHGYIRIGIDGETYYAHRLAVFYVTGRWSKLTDHRNLNGLDNRWENIREATKSQNSANRKAPKINKLGVKGVSLCKATGLYRVDIRKDGKGINLGRYALLDVAKSVYDKAAKEMFGDFARC